MAGACAACCIDPGAGLLKAPGAEHKLPLACALLTHARAQRCCRGGVDHTLPAGESLAAWALGYGRFVTVCFVHCCCDCHGAGDAEAGFGACKGRIMIRQLGLLPLQLLTSTLTNALRLQYGCCSYAVMWCFLYHLLHNNYPWYNCPTEACYTRIAK
jgi:hypothetical protein